MLWLVTGGRATALCGRSSGAFATTASKASRQLLGGGKARGLLDLNLESYSLVTYAPRLGDVDAHARKRTFQNHVTDTDRQRQRSTNHCTSLLSHPQRVVSGRYLGFRVLGFELNEVGLGFTFCGECCQTASEHLLAVDPFNVFSPQVVFEAVEDLLSASTSPDSLLPVRKGEGMLEPFSFIGSPAFACTLTSQHRGSMFQTLTPPRQNLRPMHPRIPIM